jgi:TP901 family phage tail tape measure protein
MDTARASTATWAKIAQATGSTVSDIAQTAAALSQQMGIGPAQMEETFSALAQQGKAGAIELKDLAGVMSQIAPMWGQFKGGKGIESVRELGAALQIVKRGFGGDAGETVTGLQGLLVALQKNAGRFKEHGIKIFDVDKGGKETMRGVFEIVDAISKSDLVKHPDEMEKAFGRVEAYRAYLQLTQNREALHQFVEESRDAGLIQRDFDTYMQSSAGRLEKAWNDVKVAVADMLTPERVGQIVAGIESIGRSLPSILTPIGRIVEGFERFVHMVARAKGHLQGDSHYANSGGLDDEEKALVNALELEKSGKQVYWNQEDRAKAQRLQQRAKDYDAAMDEINGAEDDFGATDESIKRALRVSRSRDLSPKGQAYTEAGRSYLIGRDKEISPDRYRRLREEVDKEKQAASPAAYYMNRYDDILDEDNRKRAAQVRYYKEHLQPTVKQISDLGGDMVAQFERAMVAAAPVFGRSVAQAIARTPPPAPTVKIGSEPIANAGRNAQSVNTRPGGMP